MNAFESLKQVLSLKADPVGVKLIYDHDNSIENDIRFKEGDSNKEVDRKGKENRRSKSITET